MTKSLAYCAFLHRPQISLPDSGVSSARVLQETQGELGLLWSEVEWPFDPSVLQRSAVEFHGVVSHMFSQGAVVPFRLLSVFDDLPALQDFLARHRENFIADLERLQGLVQMECVLYFTPGPVNKSSGRDYLEKKAELVRGAEAFAQNIRDATSGLSREIHVRESKNGSRIFVLVERGNEKKFHSIVQDLPVPERLARRMSGPWPPAEFLSDWVKMPQIAGQR